MNTHNWCTYSIGTCGFCTTIVRGVYSHNLCSECTLCCLPKGSKEKYKYSSITDAGDRLIPWNVTTCSLRNSFRSLASFIRRSLSSSSISCISFNTTSSCLYFPTDTVAKLPLPITLVSTTSWWLNMGNPFGNGPALRLLGTNSGLLNAILSNSP